MKDNWKKLKTWQKIGIVVLILAFLGMLLPDPEPSDTTASTETVQEETKKEEAKKEPELSEIDKTAATIKAEARDGECNHEVTGEALFTVHGLYGSHIGQFVTYGKRVFEGDDCQSFNYTLYVDSMDDKGNDSKMIAMMLTATKEQFNEYNWENLEGAQVYDRLNRDNIIVMMNKVGVDTSKIRLGPIE